MWKSIVVLAVFAAATANAAVLDPRNNLVESVSSTSPPRLPYLTDATGDRRSFVGASMSMPWKRKPSSSSGSHTTPRIRIALLGVQDMMLQSNTSPT